MKISRSQAAKTEIERLFRAESGRVLAGLSRTLRDFHLAEESLQEAFAIAAEKWPVEGLPANPRSWLVSTARFKAIDRIRRESRFSQGLEGIDEQTAIPSADQLDLDEQVEDDLLRLIFLCCHPSLPPEGQIALTLREVCGLKTDEIARAFLVSESTMGQRISRAKARLREIGATFDPLNSEEKQSRLPGVLKVVYLVFNEGYYSSKGTALTSAELSKEALRLGDLLAKLFPHPEVFGLNALMCFSESRRKARENEGEIVLLEDQDRSQWNQELIAKARQSLEQSLKLGELGPYTLQACIAAEHAAKASVEETNWKSIVDLYSQLNELTPSAIVQLNRAVAIAMAGDLDRGLADIEHLINTGRLENYSLAHAAKADLLRRLDRFDEAKMSYLSALNLTKLDPERRFLMKRLAQINQRLQLN